MKFIYNDPSYRPPADPGPATSEKDRAVDLARAVLKQPDDGDPLHLLARQLLRALGLSAAG